jgi:hypothetical protein
MDILPALKTGKLIVIYSPDAAVMESMTLAAELGLQGPVTLLDGGNRYKPSRIGNLLRRKTMDIETAANRILSRRAFTCYEMNTLLASTPSVKQPYLILDLLNTFYDDHVPAHEAQRLLGSCLDQIHRLTICGPVILTLAPPLVAGRMFLLDQVCRRADEIFVREEPEPQSRQLFLF